jgi:EAL domain-containing protein (putative c-di-GMP-specific phosphodiesterase class I)
VLVGLLDITMFQRLNDALGESVANRVPTHTGLRIRALPHLLSRLSSIIEAAGVATQRIEFELTESLAMQRPDQAAEVLSAFRDQAGSIVHQPKAWRPKNRQRR